MPLLAQRAIVRDAPTIDMPAQVDSNSPAFWLNGRFHLFNSIGLGPALSEGPDQKSLGTPLPATVSVAQRYWPAWIESVWVDDDGTIYAWYHQENPTPCPGRQLSVPQIGAAVSYNGGFSFQDLGIVMSSGDPVACESQNGYFAGGNGDFSVIPDRDRGYFYFLFTNYAGPAESQGVAIARMAFDDRHSPRGRVWKYWGGNWNQPAIGGTATAIFPAKVSWQDSATNSLWGPAIHWNTYLNSYVMLMNQSCCTAGWPQAGIWVSFNADLSNPASWTRPKKILDGTWWYPQVIGFGPGETDTQAGRVARLFIYGQSRWKIIFDK